MKRLWVAARTTSSGWNLFSIKIRCMCASLASMPSGENIAAGSRKVCQDASHQVPLRSAEQHPAFAGVIHEKVQFSSVCQKSLPQPFSPPALRLCVNLPIILKSAPWLLDMVVDSCLPLLYLRALNVCQSLISQSDFKMSYLSLRHTAESSDSYRCKVGLIWFSNWVQPAHHCSRRIIVFVIDMIDSCKHSGLAPLNAFLHLPELERNAFEAHSCYSAMRPLLLTDIS